MSKYDYIVLDIETTGSYSLSDEVLQVSIRNSDGTVLLNEYCKALLINDWDGEITFEMVRNKKPFEEYVDRVISVINNADTLIVYNQSLLNLLERYNIKFNNKVYDLMEDFAEVYGEWNDYFRSYTWKPLKVCCYYYGYYSNKVSNSLGDCNSILYCYKKLMNNEEKYNASEYLGISVKEFLDKLWDKVDYEAVRLSIYPLEEKLASYISKDISEYTDLGYSELLQSKIHQIKYVSQLEYKVYVEKCLEADYDLLKYEIVLLNDNNKKLSEDIHDLMDNRHRDYELKCQ